MIERIASKKGRIKTQLKRIILKQRTEVPDMDGRGKIQKEEEGVII